MFRVKRKKNILSIIDDKHVLLRLGTFIVSCFFFALSYNTFLVPNNLVVGGMSGLAIVVKELTGLSTTTFLYFSMAVLVVLSYIILGKEHAINTIVGSVIFSFMVTITAPLAEIINTKMVLGDDLILIIISSVSYGIPSGLIYKSGYNTGGSDVIACIFNKLFKIPIATANAIVNSAIIASGFILFGPQKTMYAIIILLISSKLVDMVMLGQNDSKMCFIKTKNYEYLEDYLINGANLGVTEINSTGGIFRKKDPLLLVIMPFDKYYGIKHLILDKDPSAFIVTHDCYTVSGGYKRKVIPF